MNTVGIITKPQFPDIKPVVEDLLAWLKKHGKRAVLGPAAAALVGQNRQLDSDELSQSDVIVVLGGDGTMLSAARQIEPFGIPILGVNMGGLGFLTETTVDQLYASLEKVFSRQFHLDTRIRLKGTIARNTEQIARASALNDVVVSKGTVGRMIKTRIWIDKKFVTNLRGDGVILASPTGSTAYAMSAGGPILDPALEAWIVVPINPHTLTHRPLLVPSSASLEIHLVSSEGASLSFDGQVGFEMNAGDTITINASSHRTRLIRFPDRTYYDVLRTKLKWGDGEDRPF